MREEENDERRNNEGREIEEGRGSNDLIGNNEDS